MKKIILIFGGVILVAVLGRGIWTYQQMKADEAKMVNTSILDIPVLSESTQTKITTETPPISTVVVKKQTPQEIGTVFPSADKKHLDTLIKVDLAGFRTLAELYHDNNKNSYAGICADTSLLTNPIVFAGSTLRTRDRLLQTSGSVVCKDSPTAWAMSAQLVNDKSQYLCADNLGYLIVRNSSIATTSCK